MQCTVTSTFDATPLAVSDEGSGPAIVLIHGLFLAKESWEAQAAALAARARVIRVDLRGHGASGVPAGPYLMETLAGDLFDVLDLLDIERAAIVGHSLGGYVAFAFYRMFAERCSGLGLVCTRATADDDAGAAFRYELADRIDREGMAPAVEAFAPRSLAPATYRERPDIEARLRGFMERTDPGGAAAMLRGMAARVSSEDLFDEIDVPVRIVSGTYDAVIPPASSEAMVDGMRAATLDVLETGHVPLLEEPNGVAAALERLLDATAARA